MKKAIYEVFQHNKFIMSGTIDQVSEALGQTETQLRRVMRTGDKGFIINNVGSLEREYVLYRTGQKDETGTREELVLTTGVKWKTLYTYKFNHEHSKTRLRETGNFKYVYHDGYEGYEAEQRKKYMTDTNNTVTYKKVKARPFVFNSYITSLVEGCFKKW